MKTYPYLCFIIKNNKTMAEKLFTVWVGGVEVNDNYLTKEEADRIATEYEDEGYDDVVIEEII